MLEWIEDVLKPNVANVPPGIVPILFLDSFTVHKMGSVVNAIQALGVEVDFIPPGCTGMVQPVDVGYNKPFKASSANSTAIGCSHRTPTSQCLLPSVSTSRNGF